MAQVLQREHSLPVVAVRLTQDASGPLVTLGLVVNDHGQQVLQGSRTLPLREFGGRTTPRADPRLAVPEAMVRFVGAWARGVLEPDRALWLHLVKPYGVLGAVPWERDLVPVLNRPVLRLPDVLPDPSRSTSTLSVAIVATAPAPEGPPPAAQLALPVAHALDKALAGRLLLRVFVDTAARQLVEDMLRRDGFADVEVHAPAARPADSRSAGLVSGELHSGWLRWVRDTLAGRPVDAVHFLVHGNDLGTRGAILTTLEATPDRDIPISVEAAEIESFLTQVGALVAGFTRLADNWSDHGLRLVTDELGSRRAGPVLLHDPARDADGLTALEAAYRFLLSAVPAAPPTSPSLALYAQPQQVAQEGQRPEYASREGPLRGIPQLGPEERPVLRGSAPPSPAVQAHFDKEETPGWLVAAERYLEQQEGALMRFRSETQDRAPTRAELSHYAGVESALRKARDVIDRHAERLL